MPIDTLPMPCIASMTTTFEMTRSQVSATLAAFSNRPSRAVLPKPTRNSLPDCCASYSISTTSRVSPSRTRSPTVGPWMAAYAAGVMSPGSVCSGGCE